MTGSFAQRTQKFWEWFTANEEKLSALALTRTPNDADSNRIVEFVSEGLSLISQDIRFNIGGEHEFTFTVSGNSAMFFLLPYITANLPQQFRDKWKFFPCMPGTGGNNFGFRMIEHDKIVDTDNVFVSVTPDEENKSVDLRFYAKEWEVLDDNNCYNAFFTLMDISIGEALAHAYINKVDRATAHTDDMIALTTLEKWLLDNLCEDGKIPNPADKYFAYQQKPDGNTNPPRLDIFTGSGNYTPIINDYYNGEDITYKTFAGFGAKSVFLYYYYDEKADQKVVLNQRYELQYKLEAEVLGERGSGKEIGLSLGGAMGNWCAYIDLLLFDDEAFFEKAKTLLADTSIMFFCQEFVHNGQTLLLFDQDDDSFNQRLQQLHEVDVHFEIADILEALPEMDYTQKGIYARALNNLNREDEALKVLESVREQGENDKLWFFRYGYALMNLDRPKEAITAFHRAKELGDDLEDTDQFIAMCEEALKK